MSPAWHAAAVRRCGLFREPSRPQDMQHHALLRGLDARLFDVMVRDLRLRLFDGRVQVRPETRLASFRQGLSQRFAASLFLIGALALLVGSPAGSELGRSFRRLAWDGGAAHAAVPALLEHAAPRPPLAAAGLGAMAAGLLLASLNRKQVWLVSRPGEREGEIDIWVAGTSWGREAQFEAEFAAFLERAARLDGELHRTRDLPRLAASAAASDG